MHELSENKNNLIIQKIEFLKLKFEKHIEAYFDIYNSIWKIFSYMSAVTAAILIGIKQFFPCWKLNLLVIFSAPPIIFWYFGVYLPMNRYGEKRLIQIKNIEENIYKLLDIMDEDEKIFFNAFKKNDNLCEVWRKYKFHSPSKWMRVKYMADLIGWGLFIIWLIFIFIFIVDKYFK